jgi:acylphosphatase
VRQTDSARLRVIVYGRVQGVFFRASAADEAKRLRITGFACNLADGSVEIIAEGDGAALELLLAWARNGPPRARVERVEVEWSAATGEFRDFISR